MSSATWGGKPIMKPNIRIIKATEQDPWGVCGAIYGKPGVGKTTFLCDAAESEYGAPLLMIDVEGGARSVSHREDVDILPITNVRSEGFRTLIQVVDLLCEYKLGSVLDNKPDDYKPGTILVDNASEIIALAVSHVIKTVARGQGVTDRDRPDQKDWSIVNTEMLLLVRKLRDFARTSGTNVFFIAWEKHREDEATSRNMRDMAFNPSFASTFPGIVDMVGLLTVRSNGERQISFEASEKTAAKFRRSGTEAANQIPDVIRYKKGDKPILDILATLKGNKPWPAAKYTKA